MQPTDYARIVSSAVSMDKLSYEQLEELRNDPEKVDVYWKFDAQSDSRLICNDLPVALVRAFSPYLARQLDADPARRAVTVTGGAGMACSLAVGYMFGYCDDKTFVPQLRGLTLLPWIHVHEAAQLLEMPTLERTALDALNQLLDEPVTLEDLKFMLAFYPGPGRYEDMVVDNLSRAIMCEQGGWDAGGLWCNVLETQLCDSEFFTTLKTGLRKKMKIRREAEAAEAAAQEFAEQVQRKDDEKSRKMKIEVEKYEQLVMQHESKNDLSGWVLFGLYSASHVADSARAKNTKTRERKLTFGSYCS